VKLLSGFRLSSGFTVSINKAIGWSSFDVKIETPDMVKQARFQRATLVIVLKRFKETGLLQVENVELNVPTMTERMAICEQAEAVMRQEL
jgi:hypothetical protein